MLYNGIGYKVTARKSVDATEAAAGRSRDSRPTKTRQSTLYTTNIAALSPVVWTETVVGLLVLSETYDAIFRLITFTVSIGN